MVAKVPFAEAVHVPSRQQQAECSKSFRVEPMLQQRLAGVVKELVIQRLVIPNFVEEVVQRLSCRTEK